jgi:hypothetical protein
MRVIISSSNNNKSIFILQNKFGGIVIDAKQRNSSSI